MTDFHGKKVAVLGLGIEGQDLCHFLLKKGAKITVFDQKEAVELGLTYQKFKDKGLKFVLGKDYLKKDLKGFSIIFRSQGFRRSKAEIIKAEDQGSIISSSTKLFFDFCPGKIIGVTGTKGKGTTATLIYQILKKAKKDAYLAGNIGQPMLALLPRLSKESWVVLELSSFQLQDMTESPQIAVVLFITSEHLDYHPNLGDYNYHRDVEEYIMAKSNIVRYQTQKDFAVVNADDKTAASFAQFTAAKVIWFSRRKKVKGSFVKNRNIYLFGQLIGKVENLQIPGAHNWENVTAASLAAHLAGASLESIREAIFSFKGLEHRLELVKEFKGIKFYDDSFSTTPETSIAAVQAFKKPIILIAGGSEKGSDFTNLGKEIARSSAKTLILIGEMAERIKKACQEAKFRGKIIFRPKNMKEIVDLALKETRAGDIVLFSPACASFDMFKNYKERGNQFKKYVQKI